MTMMQGRAMVLTSSHVDRCKANGISLEAGWMVELEVDGLMGNAGFGVFGWMGKRQR